MTVYDRNGAVSDYVLSRYLKFFYIVLNVFNKFNDNLLFVSVW